MSQHNPKHVASTTRSESSITGLSRHTAKANPNEGLRSRHKRLDPHGDGVTVTFAGIKPPLRSYRLFLEIATLESPSKSVDALARTTQIVNKNGGRLWKGSPDRNDVTTYGVEYRFEFIEQVQACLGQIKVALPHTSWVSSK
jgi:hypothetical protein